MEIDLYNQYKFLTIGKYHPPLWMFIRHHVGYTCVFCGVTKVQMYASTAHDVSVRVKELKIITRLDIQRSCFCKSCFELLLNDVDTLVFKYNLGLL